MRVGALAAMAALDPDPGWARDLAGLVTSPSPSTRIAAYEVLGLDARPASVAMLLARRSVEPAGRPRAALEAALDVAWPGEREAPDVVREPGAFEAAWEKARDGDPARVRELRARLEAGEVEAVTRRLARAAAAADGTELVPVLTRCLAEGPRERAVLACRLIRLGAGNWGPEEAMEVFEAAGPGDRPWVARALARFGVRPFREAFRGDLLGADPTRRRAAAQGLGMVGEPEDARALAVLVRAEDRATAPVAWDALGDLLRRHPGALAPGDLATLAGRSAGAPDVALRRALCRALPRMPEPGSLLEALRRDPDPLVRGSALRATLATGWGRRPALGDLPGVSWG